MGHPWINQEWIGEVRRYLERLSDIPGSVNTIQISEAFSSKKILQRKMFVAQMD